LLVELNGYCGYGPYVSTFGRVIYKSHGSFWSLRYEMSDSLSFKLFFVLIFLDSDMISLSILTLLADIQIVCLDI